MKSFLTFVVGVGIGAVVSTIYYKNKYEEQINEEFREAREYRRQEQKNRDAANEKADEIIKANKKEGTDIGEIYEEHLAAKEKAKNIINYNGYAKSSDTTEEDKKPEPIVIPYVITPDEFASEVGYDTDSFYIFEDDVIADENNDKIDNVKETFGLTVEEIRNQFGVYEDDSVYIRNERLKVDYEILRELDTYEKRNGE